MKRILLLVGLVFALVVPSAASASEPAEWYKGEVAVGEGEDVYTQIVDGWFEIDRPSLGWDFKCDANYGTLGSWGFAARGLFTCDNSNPTCNNFTAELSSDGTPLVPSKENGVIMLDTSSSEIVIEFRAGEGYYQKTSCMGLVEKTFSSGSPLHGTWENLPSGLGRVEFDDVMTTAGTLNASFLVQNTEEGYYQAEVGPEEFEEVWGPIPVSIH